MIKNFIFFLLLNTFIFASGFDDISIGDKVKIKHMAQTYKSGIIGDTLYVYEANQRKRIKDKEGALQTNTILTDGKTLRRNRKLDVTVIRENVEIRRISGKTKRHHISKSLRNKNLGLRIGFIDIRDTNIKNVKVYRKNNKYRIE